MKNRYNIKFRITKDLFELISNDLKKEHNHAWERVGFIKTRSRIINDKVIITAFDYIQVDDRDYIYDDTVGARINSDSIRKAMQHSLTEKCGIFHVHSHNHLGLPYESTDDIEGIQPMMNSICCVNSNEFYGYTIFSEDSILCKIKNRNEEDYSKPSITSIVGYPMKFVFENNNLSVKRKEKDKRQSFIGNDLSTFFKNVKIGVIGYGGGGSHIGQQLAHIGFENIVVFDDDILEESNTNRLIGGKFSDIRSKTLKVDIAERTISEILPTVNLMKIAKKWQLEPETLHECDIVIGGVDSYMGRHQLESECRRYFIPYLDLGMDVYKIKEGYSISGQVILSMPEKPCMKCMGFINEDKLEAEALKYGNVGGNPQVVWSNGVLASNAVGILVDLIFGWSGLKDRNVYMTYDGRRNQTFDHPKLSSIPKKCTHYLIEQSGSPIYSKV